MSVEIIEKTPDCINWDPKARSCEVTLSTECGFCMCYEKKQAFIGGEK